MIHHAKVLNLKKTIFFKDRRLNKAIFFKEALGEVLFISDEKF
jgi:hypothetical protein